MLHPGNTVEVCVPRALQGLARLRYHEPLQLPFSAIIKSTTTPLTQGVDDKRSKVSSTHDQ